MGSLLEVLSNELIEMLVKYLELNDIRSLRRTSRILEKKTSQGYLTTFFTHKNVELTAKTLRDMVRVTRQGRPGCFLQHCTITGVVRGEADEGKEDEEDKKEHLLLLAEAFGNLKQHSLNGGIDSLYLSVTVMDGHLEDEDGYVHVTHLGQFRSRKAVWSVAASAFNVTMAALDRSQLPVRKSLNVFGNVKGCSLSCDVFQAFAQKIAVSIQMFRSLKRLTLSLSAPIQDAPDDRRVGGWNIEAEDECQRSHSGAFLQHIPWVLRSMPELESFDMHWYFVRSIKPASPATYMSAPLEDGSTNLSKIMHLKRCSLHGIYASENNLLQFFRAIQPAALTLTYIRLVSNSNYDKIFDYLTNVTSPVTEYHLDDICKGNKLVHYEDIPGSAKFRYSGDPVGPSTLTRSSGHVRRPIRYSIVFRRALGSGELNRWRKSKDDEFGSYQNFYSYDFVALNTPPLWYVRGPDSPDEDEDD